MKLIRTPSTVSFLLMLSFLLTSSNSIQSQKRDQKSAVSKAAVLVEEADKLAEAHKYSEAIERYKLGIRLDPNYAAAFGGLGDAYLVSGDATQALAAYREQVRLAPADAWAHYDLGYFFNAMGRYGEAFAPLIRATTLDPTFQEAFYEIGYAYLRTAEFEKSIPFFRSAIRLKPDFVDAHYRLGQAYVGLGRSDLAAAEQKKLASIDPHLSSKLEQEIPASIAAAAVKPVAKPAETENRAVVSEPAKQPSTSNPQTEAPLKTTVESTATTDRSAVAEATPKPATSPAQDKDQVRQLVQPSPEKGGNLKRIALVIGNSLYTGAPQLKNPQNDARDMAAMLTSLGFEVTSSLNVTQREMKRLIREFGQKLKSGGAGLFYYAGHGVQSKGHNYLIPIDAEIQSEPEVEDFGVDVNLVLNFMDEAQNGVNIVILDACRDNPFGRSFRSASNGLAQVEAPTGTLIAYATAPGRVASDGSSRNGLYTEELLKQMPLPGVSSTEMFMHVRAAVMKATANKQVPWEASSLVGTFYFNASSARAANSKPDLPSVETKGDSSAFELAYWDSIKNSTDREEFKSYLEKYPQGHFAELANNKLRQLAAADKGPATATPPDTNSRLPQPPIAKASNATAFDVKNGVRRTPGILEVSRDGLSFREVGGRNDFNIPCSALQVVSINTSWASTVYHKLHLKYLFNGIEKQVDVDGKNNKQIRDFILESCGMSNK